MFSTYNHTQLSLLMSMLNKLFSSSFRKVMVNENKINKLKEFAKTRKGPIILIGTHRSYVDFLVLSAILMCYGMEVPLICAGEDFKDMPFFGDLLRGSGAFYMRRTFKGDELYKAVFYEYVRMLNKDK